MCYKKTIFKSNLEFDKYLDREGDSTNLAFVFFCVINLYEVRILIFYHIMGNIIANYPFFHEKDMNSFTPVSDFKFHCAFEVESTNGLCLNNYYIPEEIIWNILCYVPPKQLLNSALVCKKWCNIIKSDHFWMILYSKHYLNKVKHFPWYVYYSFFTTKNYDNLLKNTHGQNGYKHWTLVKNFGDEFQIENPPIGADPLPANIQDFGGHTGCFATSFYECNKIQVRDILGVF